MSHNRLLFLPSNPQQNVDTTRLVECLSTCGMIDSPDPDQGSYLAGEEFLSLLTFLGCSPNISLRPGEGVEHCTIELFEHTASPTCRGYTRTARPKCPSCTKRIEGWDNTDWTTDGSKLCTCDKCGNAHPYAELNWKQECAFSRGGFVITQIYPHEAVPTDRLLKTLEDDCGFPWQYAYANNAV